MIKRTVLVLMVCLLPLNAAPAVSKPPFLINSGMPHFVKHVKALWDDTGLNLDKKQQASLLKIRKKTVAQVRRITAELKPLEAGVARSALLGELPQTQQRALDAIAKLKTEATMAHLACIYETRAVLSPEQYDYLLDASMK